MFVVGKYNVRPMTGQKILRGNLTVMKIIVIILAVFIFLLRFKVVGNNQTVTCHIHGYTKWCRSYKLVYNSPELKYNPHK